MNKKLLISEISRMKSLFGYQKGVVISEQFPTFQQPFQQKASGFPIDCTGVAVGLPTTAQMQQNFATNSGLNPNVAENKIFFCDTASMNKKLLEIQGKTQQNAQAAAGAAPAAPAAPPAPKFVAEKFPLKYMMQGENVKKLQQALGVVNSKGQANITGKFYNATQKALDAKAKELGLSYDRNVGLDETSFNEIIQAAQPKRQLEKPVTVPTTTKSVADLNVDVQVPTNISARPTQIQAPQTQLTLDQQFQLAKANLDTAKAELDAAQKTGDRVAIGTARGKQQAARQEVRRLRGELAAQNQTPQ
jgi:hypothetical protein